jgi:ATP-dependent Lhr-like helicase
MMKSIPSYFHPLIREWFAGRYGTPTDVQEQSWPLIASGRNLLITSPTGSGKTFAAFLWALNQLVSGRWPCGVTSLLYVSPLKALNNDIRENLAVPMGEIRKSFTASGGTFPPIRIQTRSGDTPAAQRQKMIAHPPELLITTPESLNLMLSSRRARGLFSTVRCVILDELHAVISTKRGSHLITAVDRLVPIAGDFQRIALSATVRPLGVVAEFLGGHRLEHGRGEPTYRPRPVSIVTSGDEKRFRVLVRYPARAPGEQSLLPSLVRECKRIIEKNRSTLLFTNTRRHSEKIAWMINEGGTKEAAYSHHGSLSKEIRTAVEKQLREGLLKAIVATSSLELGIDIGVLDEVVLIQTPPSILSGIQRIGRAGHAVGSVSSGVIYPLHGRDLIDAAVCAKGIMEKDIEDVKPVKGPLDVLAQVIVSMAGVRPWKVGELFDLLRTSYPFSDLSREQFDLVLMMLNGKYQNTRVRELSPRVTIDRIDGVVKGREGVLTLVYRSGGTIPDRGYYGMLHRDTGKRIGELDEEFVWERRIGDSFSMGAQSWQITRMDSQNVEVIPWKGPIGIAPFWKAGRGYRGFHFFERVGVFLEHANTRIHDEDFSVELRQRYFMEDAAANELIGLLKRQKVETGCDLPHRHHLLFEELSGPLHPAGMIQLFLYTFWGGRVNKPYSLALSAALRDRFGGLVDVFCDDDALLFVLPRTVDVRDLLSMVHPGNLRGYLKKTLEQTGFFGALFRENAGRALLLPKSGFQSRFPLWLNRLRSKKLYDAVAGFSDFPITIETWRQCLNDEFDMDNLQSLLEELSDGRITYSTVQTGKPSPFALGLLWWQTNSYLYADDTLGRAGASTLGEEIFHQLLFSAPVRPRIDDGIAASFQQKLHRESAGYLPGSTEELVEWISERILVPLRLPGAPDTCVAAVQELPKIAGALGLKPEDLTIVPEESLSGRPSTGMSCGGAREFFGKLGPERERGFQELLGEWLYSYGPIEITRLREVFGVSETRLEEALAGLAREERVIVGRLTKGADTDQVCDAKNLESLLRISRAAARPAFQPLGGEYLPLFIAQVQGIRRMQRMQGLRRTHGNHRLQGAAGAGNGPDALKAVLEQLFGYPAPVELWESSIFPARIEDYSTGWLDSLFSASDLMWFGCGNRRASFCFFPDYPLFFEDGCGEAVMRFFPDPSGKYSFVEMLHRSSMGGEELHTRLWEAVWEGKVLNDSWSSIRSGGYRKFDPAAFSRRSGRLRADRWTAGRLYSGGFFLYRPEGDISSFEVSAAVEQSDSKEPAASEKLSAPEEPAASEKPFVSEKPSQSTKTSDSERQLEELEMNKERVRQLLLRYGLLFRELLENECPGLRWGRLFKTLRIMELSGELVGGYFFQGVPGIQFISPPAFQLLRYGLGEDEVYWMNACDPASLCGVRLENPDPRLPPRIPANHIVYRGTVLVLVSRRRGRDLRIFTPPDDPFLQEYFDVFRSWLERDFHPETSVKVERINDEPVRESPYAAALLDFGFRKGYRYFSLEKKF